MTDRNPAARRRRRVRALTYTAAVLLSLFVLIPIYLITVTAFTPREVSYEFPKPFIPGTVSAETVRFFAGSTGVLAALWRSVVVAALTLALSTLLGAPAGYALPATPSAARAPTAW
jgi:multiple sugar transport system permease protein